MGPSLGQRLSSSYGLKVGVAFLAVIVFVAAIGGGLYRQTSDQLHANAGTQIERRATDHATPSTRG